ncbi:MAG TPA: hypothetical protein VM511_02020, partial [Luteolibacter sp.]|nr:hypothetical protein [Luteolibacter sp.]
MIVFESKVPLEWGSLDVPLLGIAKDWHGSPMEAPAGFALVADPQRLWFVAMHRNAANLHPKSRPGLF